MQQSWFIWSHLQFLPEKGIIPNSRLGQLDMTGWIDWMDTAGFILTTTHLNSKSTLLALKKTSMNNRESSSIFQINLLKNIDRLISPIE